MNKFSRLLAHSLIKQAFRSIANREFAIHLFIYLQGNVQLIVIVLAEVSDFSAPLAIVKVQCVGFSVIYSGEVAGWLNIPRFTFSLQVCVGETMVAVTIVKNVKGAL